MMKNPVRVCQSRWLDTVTFDFKAMTATHEPRSGGGWVDRYETRAEMWLALRKVRATFADPSY